MNDENIVKNDDEAEPAPFITGSDMLTPLRALGLNEKTGLSELCDNAIDANATEIDIWVEDLHKDVEGYRHRQIVCMDNGCGFKDENVIVRGHTYTLLSHAVTYGGRAELDSALQRIGKFGFGLPSTIIHLSEFPGPGAEVLTKMQPEKLYRSCEVNLSKMEETGEWSLVQKRKTMGQIGRIPGPIDRPMEIIDSGTIIWLKDVKSDYNSLNEFVMSLVKYFGMIYRKYLESGLIIRINGNKVDFNDPLCENKMSKERISGLPGPVFIDEFSIIFDGNKVKTDIDDGNIHWKREIIDTETNSFAKINVRMVRLNSRDVKSANSKSLATKKKTAEDISGRRFNMENQGFYLVRNQRQIRGGENFGLYHTQDRLNYFRAEISFPTCLDDFFGIVADKSQLRINRNLSSQVKNKITPILSRMRKDHNREVASEQTKIDINDPQIENVLSETKAMPNLVASKDFITGSVKKRNEIIKIKLNQVEEEDISKEIKEAKIARLNRIKNQESTISIFEDVIRSTALYEVRPRSRGIDVIVNTMTKFYEDVYAPSSAQIDHRNLLDFMITCMSWAECTMVKDEDDEYFQFWTAARESMGASAGRIVDEFRKSYNPSEDL